jgi:hypothetical protein
MSFLPKVGSEEFEELFRLFAAGHQVIGQTPKEILDSQRQLRERLQIIWDAIEPKPREIVFADFRRSVVELFLARLKKEDPRFRRPRA